MLSVNMVNIVLVVRVTVGGEGANIRGCWRPHGLNFRENGIGDQGNIREFFFHFLWEPWTLFCCYL